MIANKNAITTRAIVVISKRDVLENNVAGVGLKGVFAGMFTVCVLLQLPVSYVQVPKFVSKIG